MIEGQASVFPSMGGRGPLPRKVYPKMSFWDIVWFIFIFFAFMAYLMVLFSIITDIFRDRELSGWGKAAWIIGLFVLPFLVALIYIIARGRGMTERQISTAKAVQSAQEDYIKSVAGGGAPNAADQIAKAKELLDAGTINQQEYEALKAKALA
jgi:hypothetical protein